MERYQINPAWKLEAKESSKKRRDFHEKRNSKRHWNEPKKGKYTQEYYGDLAQIIFREYLKEKYHDKELTFAPLYTPNLAELPVYDMLIDGKTVDVKCIPPDDEKTRTRMLVKVSEFKNLDYYVGVKLWSDDEYSLCGYAKGTEVAEAPKKSFGFEPAHELFMDKLHKFKI